MQKTASTLLATAQAKAAALEKQRTQLEAESKKFKDLLATLTAQQRAEIAKRKAAEAAAARAAIAKAAAAQQQATTAAPQATPAPPPAATGGVQKAVDYAIAQVGKAYVFAGTGPDAFDCSGLTMMAWAQGGVSLPHEASAQYNYGTHVSASDLQPGDLVFLYSPISHVEIMVGPDLAVSAADPALGVRYVHPSQDMQDFAGATRLT
jgi:cell wall-associated NlpC family hydrolase